MKNCFTRTYHRRTALLMLSFLELLIKAENKLNTICIFVLGSNAHDITLLHLTYFLLAQLSDFNRTLFACTYINIPQDGLSLRSICLLALLNAY